ncbi:hypothetical protein LGM90_19090 [Burkholderia sp. AU28942]|uniref:hypothetical protein n=1 Tax=Burkholderia TaxID=32008 RepID=UPI001CF3CE37|nr:MULTISPECIES: hypothetical protein [Burkholderia]MCA8310618.1 hypothetical protein [Burkholderia sp. AU28942]
MTRRGRPRGGQRRERNRGGRAARAGRVVASVGVGVGVGVAVAVAVAVGVGVPCAVVRRARMRTGSAVLMRIAVCVPGMAAAVIILPFSARDSMTEPVVMVAATFVPRRAARRRIAMRVLAGCRHRIGNGSRMVRARLGATGICAVGIAVSCVAGTLGVGHDNILYGLTM